MRCPRGVEVGVAKYRSAAEGRLPAHRSRRRRFFRSNRRTGGKREHRSDKFSFAYDFYKFVSINSVHNLSFSG
jgi:hypothetical protein